MQVPFEVQHGIHHVFQNLRTGNRATLSHVTHDKDRNAVSLGNLHQFTGNRSNLRNRPDRRFNSGRLHRLDGINDHVIRLHLFDVGPDAGHVRFWIEVEVITIDN